MVHSMLFRRLAVVLSILLLAILSAFPVQAQEIVAVDLTITSVTLDRTGELIIMGIVTCAEPAEVFVRADASEQVGRTLVFGSDEMNDIVACGPAGTAVRVAITPQVGSFRPGQVNVILYAFACAPDFAICLSNGADSVDQTFKVKPTH